MGQLLTLELGKALRNKWFCLAMTAGCALAVVSAISKSVAYYSAQDLIAPFINEKYSAPFLYSCFVDWMSVEGTEVTTWLFYRLAPLLVCLPYSWTLGKELSNHYMDQLCIRSGACRVLAAKYLAAFAVGFLVCLVPQLLNFVILACNEAALVPEITEAMYIGIFEENLFSDVYYNCPIAYVFMYSIMSAALCGLWAGFVLAISSKCRSRIVTLVAPYLALIVLQFVNENIFTSLLGGVRGLQFSLFENLHAMTSQYIQNGWVILSEALLLLVASAVLFADRGRRDLL